ncbi:bifunctional metallophosphatase/5'-nucleotidase [Sandaracinus amylolyticus]|uniref:bifunctional metallophosphatase/5'-nucleotidase n=1 Tax=Sandaracinus amylolyticus TaxID=927083 RepID=UPI001F229AD7|nr:bifunctional metallophosphatase/5'-nucleotidase [Sandaracinus amylolyticus]UJR82984.1 Hypothetical protein I5071_50490 [Sandaracinus amylolyticus]
MRSALCLSITVLLAGCGSAPASTDHPRAVEARSATVMFFSDAHAQLEEHPEVFREPDGRRISSRGGGYARLAEAARRIRGSVGGHALLVDGGDTFHGTGPAAWSRGEVVLAAQRALGVDVGIPGNWEVVHGPARMRELLGDVGYPVLAANVVDDASGEPLFPATLVRDVGGVRFGFVGVTDPDVPRRQPPAYSTGLRFLDATVIAPHVRALRERDGAEVVIAITHLGLARAIALAERVPGIDVVLSGDTHERVYEPIERGGTWIVEPGAFASFLGRLDVEIERPGVRPRLRWELVELRADRYRGDPHVAQLVADALAPHRERAGRVIGHSGVPLERYGVLETSADAVVTDALREATGTEIAMSNGFRFGHPIEPGPITEGDLWMWLPVSTPLRTGSVTGAQLRHFWESEIEHVFSRDADQLFGGWLPRISGMHARFRTDRARGERVVSLDVGGRPIEDERRYSLTACAREGDPEDTLCRIANVKSAVTHEIDVHEAVRRYLRAHDPVVLDGSRRVVADDLPPHVFSQYERR